MKKGYLGKLVKRKKIVSISLDIYVCWIIFPVTFEKEKICLNANLTEII